jgi:hypothetical protein
VYVKSSRELDLRTSFLHIKQGRRKVSKSGESLTKHRHVDCWMSFHINMSTVTKTSSLQNIGKKKSSRKNLFLVENN